MRVIEWFGRVFLLQRYSGQSHDETEVYSPAVTWYQLHYRLNNAGKTYVYIPIPYLDCFCKPWSLQVVCYAKGEKVLSFLRLGNVFLSYQVHTWLRYCHVLHNVSTTCPLHSPLLFIQGPLQFIKLRGSTCTLFAVCPGPKK